MIIKFLGTSDGYPEKDRYCSCTVLTINGKYYIIDAGLALYSELLRNDMSPQNVAGIFITHMHGDHSVGLVEFLDLMRWGSRFKPEPAIFLPSQRGKETMLAVTAVMDSGKDIEIGVYAEGKVFEDENIKVTAFRTTHGAETFGFLIEAEGKKVYFTGDLAGDLSDLPQLVFDDETALVVCESAHNCLPKVADKFNNMKAKRIVINHVASPHTPAEFIEAKPMINKPFDMAYDSMEIEV